MDYMAKARCLLRQWRQERYLFGLGVLDQIGSLVSGFGKKVLVVGGSGHPRRELKEAVARIQEAGCTVVCGEAIPGARPNAPREDVYRIESYLLHYRPDCIVAIGGGSTIDACKAANVLAAYGRDCGPEIDGYFGTGLVTAAAEKTGNKLTPMIAVSTAASSGAHLTKYANVTDPAAGQKKLIVDPAIVPDAALFDYSTTVSLPVRVSIDGALDAIAHVFEVFCGARGETYALAQELAQTAIALTLAYAGRVVENPGDLEAREALGLATDLGGYAIMIGGTSGAHLTSFSLVDLVDHGTACGIMNPYYAVFYSPAIQPQLAVVGQILQQYGFMQEDPELLEGRERAEAVAAGLIRFEKSIHAPSTLGELDGFTEAHVERILCAAKDPQLSMKLQNMPIPMTSADVDTYMEPLIRAAVNGDMSLICNKA